MWTPLHQTIILGVIVLTEMPAFICYFAVFGPAQQLHIRGGVAPLAGIPWGGVPGEGRAASKGNGGNGKVKRRHSHNFPYSL